VFENAVGVAKFSVVLKVALNGARQVGDHPALPITPEDLAEAAAGCVSAGAKAVHMHPRDNSGRESLDPATIELAVRRVRAAVDVPIGVSTGAWIEPNAQRRAALVSRWAGPDMASVNLSEEGAVLVMQALLGQGIGVEAGIWSVEDVYRLAGTGLQDRLVRILVELVRPVADPGAEVWAIEAALDRVGTTAPRLRHGEGEMTWPVLRQAKRLGRDIRIGLEDTLSLPDGSAAASNQALVQAALMMD